MLPSRVGASPPHPVNEIILPPADAPQRDRLLQWWYWTGMLTADDGRRYGVESTFFEASALCDLIQGQMVQVAVTDVAARRHVLREYNWVVGAPETVNCFGLASPDGAQVAAGSGPGVSLYVGVEGYVLSLVGQSETPAVRHYGGARHRYVFGGDTLYYSRPRVRAAGTLKTPDGASHAVRGMLWFDRQYGELAQSIFNGWQWFGLHLDDGRSVMVYDYPGHPSERYGCVIERDGGGHYWHGAEVHLHVKSTWVSPMSGRVYPDEWAIRLGDLALTVTPMVHGQEMDARFWIGPKYWEGLCVVEGPGGVKGTGYVELVGDKLPRAP